MNKLTERFLKYVKYNTISDEHSIIFPSTVVQLAFGEVLVDELLSLGLEDAHQDNKGYVLATLPSNTDKTLPTIGFIAHMDTSPDFSGENVKPQIIDNYDGGDITLNTDPSVIMKIKDFPELSNYVGQTLITTDGTTLLGADNKAGIAEIITAIEYLLANPTVPHGTIKIAFTPDEEIGKGTNHFDVKKFNADYAYTIDGGEIGEVEYENFNAASAKVTIQGVNIHPGNAKNKMVNSILIGTELNAMLPSNQTPSSTENREGFFHLNSITGSVENTEMHYIIRDHSKEKFNDKKELFQNAVNFLNGKYGENVVNAEITDSYFNMKEKIEPVIHIVDDVIRAMKALGIEPKSVPIRGGTDGARLSFMGLPTPNIFTGGHNFHGKFEYIPVESMEKSVATILKIIELSVE